MCRGSRRRQDRPRHRPASPGCLRASATARACRLALRSRPTRRQHWQSLERGSWRSPYHIRWQRDPLIMIRMLMAGDGGHLLRAVILYRGLARQIRDAHHPAEPGFRAKLPCWDHAIRPVESAGHDLDARAVDAAEAQRRAAGWAEIALGDRGGAERGRLALGP